MRRVFSLSIIIIAILLVILFFVRKSIVELVTESFAKSEPFIVAVQYARNSIDIQNKVGKIKTIGNKPGGLINANSSRVSFNICGEKSKINVFCQLEKTKMENGK